MPYDLSLYISPSCQPLSKALDISKKTPLVSSEGYALKLEQIAWVIARNCDTQESPLRKPFCSLSYELERHLLFPLIRIST